VSCRVHWADHYAGGLVISGAYTLYIGLNLAVGPRWDKQKKTAARSRQRTRALAHDTALRYLALLQLLPVYPKTRSTQAIALPG